MKLNFKYEGQLHANCLFYTFTTYHKYLVFQLLSRGIRMYIDISTASQNRHIISRKKVKFSKELFFWSLISKMKVGCMVGCRVQNARINSWRSYHVSLKNVLSQVWFPRWHSTNCLFYNLTIYHKCLLSQFLSHGIPMHIPFLAGGQNGRISS